MIRGKKRVAQPAARIPASALPRAAAAVAARCSSFVIGRLAGAFIGQPEDLDRRVSPAAKELVRQAFADLGSEPVCDYHAHVLGNSTNSGAKVNDEILSWRHPIRGVRARCIASASGVSGFTDTDDEYVSRLVRLARGFGHPVRINILPLDHHYNPDGTANHDRTDFYVPNEYIFRVAEKHPDLFVSGISIHPYRADAITELERGAARGVRMVKWLPNSQGMNPSDPRNDEFYKAMRRHGMVLLTHTGREMAVDAGDMQAMGNPLLLRRALNLGVKVIMAHCGSSGRSADLDHPGKTASNTDLFLRMMDDERYGSLLFADISGTTQVNRMPHPLIDLLGRPDLQTRLVQGSDYPLPAINSLIWTRKLVRLGMITKEERRCLNEIYGCNPLLFDFILKRTLRDPASGKRLSHRIFVENPGLALQTV